MSTPAGEIVVVRVFGDIDLGTEHVLRAALVEARRRRCSHLVVDIAGIGFCSARGLRLLADVPTEPAPLRSNLRRVGYLLSGVEPRIERHLGLLGPASSLPVRYPSAAAAVLTAMAQQRERHSGVPPASDRSGPAARPGGRGAGERDRFGGVTDEELTLRASDVDGLAYRELARRHRTRTYHSALRMLGSEGNSEETAEDIAARLRAALAAFDAADPP